jgi:hypothetical protein
MARTIHKAESRIVTQKQKIAKLQNNVKLGDKRLGSDDVLHPRGPRGLRRRLEDSRQTLSAIFPRTGPHFKRRRLLDWILRVIRTIWDIFRRFVLGISSQRPQQTTENWMPSEPVLLPANKGLREAWRKQYEKVKEDVECLQAQIRKRRTGIEQKDEQIKLLPQRKKNARQFEIRSTPSHIASSAPKSLLQKIWIFVCTWQLDVFRDKSDSDPEVQIVTLNNILSRKLPCLANTKDVNSKLSRIDEQYQEHKKHLDSIIGDLDI